VMMRATNERKEIAENNDNKRGARREWRSNDGRELRHELIYSSITGK